MVRPNPTRVLVWMCVLIAVNQLGSAASFRPRLYARSFGVNASAIGLAIAVYGLARFLVAMPSAVTTSSAAARRFALGGPRHGCRQRALRRGAEFACSSPRASSPASAAALVLVRGQIVLADITTPARRGRVMAVYQGVFLFAVGIGRCPAGAGGALRPGRAVPRLHGGGHARRRVAWFRSGDTRHRMSAADAAAPPPFAAQVRLLTSHTGFVLVPS